MCPIGCLLEVNIFIKLTHPPPTLRHVGARLPYWWRSNRRQSRRKQRPVAVMEERCSTGRVARRGEGHETNYHWSSKPAKTVKANWRASEARRRSWAAIPTDWPPMTDRCIECVRYDGCPRKQRVIARVVSLYRKAWGLGNKYGGLWSRWKEGSWQDRGCGCPHYQRHQQDGLWGAIEEKGTEDVGLVAAPNYSALADCLTAARCLSSSSVATARWYQGVQGPVNIGWGGCGCSVIGV